MKFLSKKVEIKTHWDTNSKTPHSAASIDYLGTNQEGWDILQLNPKFNNNGVMAKALRSVCADMNNPDEDKGGKRKGFKYSKDESGIVNIELEDVADFLKRIHCCNCITEHDAKYTLSQINTLKINLGKTQPAQQPLLLSSDKNHFSGKKGSCVY